MDNCEVGNQTFITGKGTTALLAGELESVNKRKVVVQSALGGKIPVVAFIAVQFRRVDCGE